MTTPETLDLKGQSIPVRPQWPTWSILCLLAAIGVLAMTGTGDKPALMVLALLPFSNKVAVCGSCALWFYATHLAQQVGNPIPTWTPGDCDVCMSHVCFAHLHSLLISAFSFRRQSEAR